MLEVPIYTLRFWEDQFPMFNPNRTPKGTRKFTPTDIDMAEAIRSALYDKGLKIEGTIEFLNKTYRKSPPRKLRKCRNTAEAITLLDEVKEVVEDAHTMAKIQSVINYLSNE